MNKPHLLFIAALLSVNSPASGEIVGSGIRGCQGAIGDFVFDDLNQNGVQDLDESGIENVVMALYKDDASEPIRFISTDAEGSYSFAALCAGHYWVDLHEDSLPANFELTLPWQGNDPELDSDALQDGSLIPVRLAEDDTVINGLDIGIFQTQSRTQVSTCDGSIESLTLKWNGLQAVRVVIHNGKPHRSVMADIDHVQIGEILTVDLTGAKKDVIWEIFQAGTNSLLGHSSFHLSCSDNYMNGPEDCAQPQGNRNKSQWCDGPCITSWELAGFETRNGTMVCD